MSEPLTSENKVLDEIAAERREQLGKHGWTPEHDDEHEHGELAMAAACYATQSCCGQVSYLRFGLILRTSRGWPSDRRLFTTVGSSA